MRGKRGDVYGQVHPDESKEFCMAKLKQFELVLGGIPESEKESVCEAEARCPELLTPSFKLMFLRCDVFDVNVSFYAMVCGECSYYSTMGVLNIRQHPP